MVGWRRSQRFPYRSWKQFGELDQSIPAQTVDQLADAVRQQSGIAPDFRRYPADHTFFNDGRPVYHAESAARAWESTVPFLHEQLG